MPFSSLSVRAASSRRARVSRLGHAPRGSRSSGTATGATGAAWVGRFAVRRFVASGMTGRRVVTPRMDWNVSIDKNISDDFNVTNDRGERRYRQHGKRQTTDGVTVETAAKEGAVPSCGMARLPIGSDGFVSPSTIVGKTSKPHFFAGSCPSSGLPRSDHTRRSTRTPRAPMQIGSCSRDSPCSVARRLIGARTQELHTPSDPSDSPLP
ncbi:hypothetical protein LMG28727_03472 [Paraburkholderia kirstenboschensis]|nr:hypothetical protein LMG28727_03472 [Paraburkholderia kirstenboschensis]